MRDMLRWLPAAALGNERERVSAVRSAKPRAEEAWRAAADRLLEWPDDLELVAKLAKRVGLSRSGFAERFTERVGEAPLQYLVRWRVARAAEFLRDTDDSIAEVAARVGYESVPSFSRTFKRWRGASPAAFRRMAKGLAPDPAR